MYARWLFLFCCSLFCSVQGMAQIATCQISLKDSTENILYVGIPNEVVIKNLPAKSTVKFDGFKIASTGKNYILQPEKTGKHKLSVYDKGRVIFLKTYMATALTDGNVQLGIVKYETGKVNFKVASVKDVLVNPAVVFYCPDCKLKTWWRIVQYDITLITKDAQQTQAVSGENLDGVPFDKDIQRTIAKMKNGDRIYIEDIKAYGPDGVLRHLGGITIRIAFDLNSHLLSTASSIKLRDEIRVVVDGMVDDNIIRTSSVGWLEKLQETATNSELIQLTNYENAVVRNYAFTALTTRKNVDLFPILLQYLKDTGWVSTSTGCVGGRTTINERFILEVHPTSSKAHKYKLTPEQQITLDSILLFDSTVKFALKDILLADIRPHLQYYTRIREMAVLGKPFAAVLILAKFKNKNDVAIIKKRFESRETEEEGVNCAREYPHPSFYPFLKKMFEREWLELDELKYFDPMDKLCDAMARYPSKETYRLFEKIITLKDEVKYQQIGQDILIAIFRHPNPVFEPLKHKINLDQSHRMDMEYNLERDTY